MPTNEDHLNKIKRDFHDIARFPNTVGAIDCTHVRIKSPSVDEHLYVNRKNSIPSIYKVCVMQN